MSKEYLTDKRMKALKPADAGARYDVFDEAQEGFGVRVGPTGKRTFFLMTRFPGSANPTRRTIGLYPAISLEQGRATARDWLALAKSGTDPKKLLEEAREAEQRRRDNSFGAVVEDYIKLAAVGPNEAAPLQRKGLVVARELRAEFVNDMEVEGRVRLGLGRRSIDSITRQDIIRVVDDAVARGARYQAHNLLGHVRTLFNWAISRGVYGIEASPCDRMKPKQVIGRKALRSRVLSDIELKALWDGAETLSYPYGPLFRLLALTGQRKSEVAEAVWSEFDLKKKLWVIPAERMKMDAPHVVPLSDMAVTILKGLPRFEGGDHLFTTTGGAKPVNGFSRAKERLDEAMKAALALPVGRDVAPFVIHDIRRTMRTGLSALPISGDVAELVIAHARPGLRRVYDQFAYVDEKRRALDLWATHMRDLTMPLPANVVQLPQTTSERASLR